MINEKEILQGFLSKEPQKILASSQEVIHSVIVNRDMIKAFYAFDDFGQRAKTMVKYGFVLLSEGTEGYINTGEIECPRCHQKYIVEEEFSGGHITNSRHRKI